MSFNVSPNTFTWYMFQEEELILNNAYIRDTNKKIVYVFLKRIDGKRAVSKLNYNIFLKKICKYQKLYLREIIIK